MDKTLLKTIDDLLKDEGKIIIAIEGGCASGKTTLTKKLKEYYDANVIHMDDFFLPFEMRTPERMKEIGGNIDYERFKKEVADNILKNESFTYGVFDCSIGKVNKTVNVKYKKINIIEGVYSLHPNYEHIYNMKIFLKIDEQKQIERLKIRSPEKLERFINEWIPKENDYFKKFRIEDKCDLIFKT